MNTRIADKLRKLLALAANNPSPEESANAFAAAQALATKHRIELASISLETGDPMVKESFDLQTKRVPSWKKCLVTGVASASGVFVIQSGATFVFAGKQGDVQTVQYLFAAICAEIDSLTRQLASGQGRRYSNAFRVGCASTIAKRLREQSAETLQDARQSGTSETALAKVAGAEKAARTWYASGMSGRIVSQSVGRANDAGGYRAGQRAGSNVNLGGNHAVGRGNRALGS